MTREQIDAKYRRDYDRLYLAEQRGDETAAQKLVRLNKWRENQLAFLAIEQDGLGVDISESDRARAWAADRALVADMERDGML